MAWHHKTPKRNRLVVPFHSTSLVVLQHCGFSMATVLIAASADDDACSQSSVSLSQETAADGVAETAAAGGGAGAAVGS